MALAASLLQRHIQTSQRIEIAQLKRSLLCPTECLLRGEIFHPHEKFLTDLTEGLEVVCRHERHCSVIT